jgi:hypothetical protein
MTTRARILARIDRTEKHAWCLLAKASPKRNPPPGKTTSSPKATPARVRTAERLFAKANQLRKGLAITEAARRKEHEIRERQGREAKRRPA